MFLNKKLVLVAVISLFFYSSWSQNDSTNFVMYSKEFKLIEGIYLNFEQLKTNNPVPVNRIISNESPDDIGFLKEVVLKKTILYVDINGVQQVVKSNDIWGYSRKMKQVVR